jgi:GntR family transcriptional regulator
LTKTGEREGGVKVADQHELSALAAGVDDKLPTPMYHQIYLILRNKIIEKEFVEGDLLPSEKETCRAFGVSRITAKRALNELADGGWVVRERGRGTRVTHKGVAAPLDADVEGMLENIMAMGLETDVRLIEFDYVTPNDHIAAVLECAAGDKVQRALRVRSLDGAPFSHLVTYVPEQVGRCFDRDDLASTPLLALLERSGVIVSRAEQTLTATLADAPVATLLEVELGSPLLAIRRTVFDQQNRPVEYITGLYRPDRYQYRLNLSRVQSDAAKTWSPTS